MSCVAGHVDDPAEVVDRDRDRPGSVRRRAGRRRVHGVGGEPDVDVALSGTALDVGGEVRSRVTPRCSPIWPAPTPTTIARSPVTASSAEAVKVLARAHQSMIWTRQRQTNQLRSTLREFYPAALDAFDELAGRDALAVLAIAPTPTAGRQLSRSKIAAALRRGGRQRRIDERAVEIQTALRAEQLAAPDSDRRRDGRHRHRAGRGDRRAATPRSPGSRPSWPTVLSSTRTPRSSAPCQDWG